MQLVARIFTLLRVFVSPSRRHTLLKLCRSIDYWQNNIEPDERDLEITKRIVEAYFAATMGRGSGEQITDCWALNIHEKQRRNRELVSRREIYGLACMLKNFYRNPSCDGISPPNKFNLSRWNLLENAAYVTTAYGALETLRNSVGEKRLAEAGVYSETGNPFAVEINGALVNLCAMYSLSNAQVIIENGGFQKMINC